MDHTREVLSMLVACNGMAIVLKCLRDIAVEQTIELDLKTLPLARDWDVVAVAIERARDVAARRLGNIHTGNRS